MTPPIDRRAEIGHVHRKVADIERALVGAGDAPDSAGSPA
jgi:hypothetical protein